MFVLDNRSEQYPSSQEGNYSLILFNSNDDTIMDIYFDLNFRISGGDTGWIETDFDGFSFISTYSVSNNKIKINIKYYFSKDIIPINQYSKLKDCFEKLAKLTDEWILLEVDL